MVRYIVVHNKHEGCYDFHCYQDEVAKLRITSITINPPKIFMFDTRDQAQDFFEEYLHDIDTIDSRCRKDGDIEHVEFCTCGIIELDRDENPILFYNKRNQIFLLEHGTDVFMPNIELKEDINNMNLTNKLIRRCKSLSREQRKQYIELGKYCEDCNEAAIKECEGPKIENYELLNEILNPKPKKEEEVINIPSHITSSKSDNENSDPITPVNPTPHVNSENIVISSVPVITPIPPVLKNEAKSKKVGVVKKANSNSKVTDTTTEEPLQGDVKPKKTVTKKTKTNIMSTENNGSIEGSTTDSASPDTSSNEVKPKKETKKQVVKKSNDEKN
jgi:hypothetical protein